MANQNNINGLITTENPQLIAGGYSVANQFNNSREPGELSNLFINNSDVIYNKFSPKTGQFGLLRFGPRQPFITFTPNTGRDPNAPLVCVGKIEKRKYQYELWNALRNTSLRIVFIGPIVDDRITTLIKTNKASKNYFIGAKDREYLSDNLQNFSGLILSSLGEADALVLYEAQLAGLPIFVSEKGLGSQNRNLDWVKVIPKHIDVRRIETLKDGQDAVGNRTRVKVVKNKMAPPFKQAEFDIIYGVGISREGSLLDVGVEQEILKKSGSWYTYEAEQLGQGKENSRNFLLENPEIANEIEQKIKTKLGIGVPRAVADLPVEEVTELKAVNK
jgi:hypothetical protein